MPPPPYFEGRTSNGPVWAEHIAADFAAKGLHAANYAYCFGQAVTNVDTQFGPLQVPDLPAQIDEFKASGSGGLLGDRPVATLWAGLNDLFTALGGPTPATMPARRRSPAASAIAGGIEALAEAGIKDFVVFNMVPVEKTPRLRRAGTPIEAAAAGASSGSTPSTPRWTGCSPASAATPAITKIDIHAAMNDLIANPANYGVSDVANPCFIPVAGALPCTPEQAGGAGVLRSGAPETR